MQSWQRFRRIVRGVLKAALCAGVVIAGCLLVRYAVGVLSRRLAAGSIEQVADEARSAGMDIDHVLELAPFPPSAHKAGAALEAATVLAFSAYENDADAMIRVQARALESFYARPPRTSVLLLEGFVQDMRMVCLLVDEAMAADDAVFQARFSDSGLCLETGLAERANSLGNMMVTFAAYERAAGKGDPTRWVTGFLRLARAFRTIPRWDEFEVGRFRNDQRAKRLLEHLLASGDLTPGSLRSIQDSLSLERREFSCAEALSGTAALMLRQMKHVPEVLLLCRGLPSFSADQGPPPSGWATMLPCVEVWRRAREMRACIETYEAAISPPSERYRWTLRHAVSEGEVNTEPQSDAVTDDQAIAPYARLVYVELTGVAVLALAESACAVERYRLVHGAWPAALSDLVPEFLSAVPPDPYDGTEVKYAMRPDGVMVYAAGYPYATAESVQDASEASGYLPDNRAFILVSPDLRERIVEHVEP